MSRDDEKRQYGLIWHFNPDDILELKTEELEEILRDIIIVYDDMEILANYIGNELLVRKLKSMDIKE